MLVLLTKLIGLFILILGIVCLVLPGHMRGMVRFWEKGKRLYGAAVIRFSFAVILLLSAAQCARPAIIVTLGVLFMIGGILIIAYGLERSKALISRWSNTADWIIRIMALLVIGMGAVILYSA